jgi:hypothetical protein
LDEQTDTFYSTLGTIADQTAPLRSITVSSIPKHPWYTNEIRNKIRSTRQLERRSKKHLFAVPAFGQSLAQLKDMTDQALHNYLKNTGNIFAALKSLDCSSNDNTPVPISPDTFADYFISKVDKICRTFNVNNVPVDISVDTIPQLSTFQNTSNEYLILRIKSAKLTHCESDIIPASILLDNIDIIIHHITDIINQSRL